LSRDSLEHRDAAFIARCLPLLEWFNRRYFHLECEGTEHLAGGPTLFVANHNGGIMGPDLFCTLGVLWRRLRPEHPLYALAHDFAMRQVPPLGKVLRRFGALRASRANAANVLERGGSVLVYPGGDLDAYRHSRRRNEVVILPRKGFVDVARAARARIVPIVAQGAHRSAYIFHEGLGIARALGMQKWARLERFPLAFALPWLFAPGPWLPYLPLPLKIRLRILPPVHVDADEDSASVARRIQTSMQSALTEMCH
jgi:1-acyl-sn-glycerol-3-phosphate acyltransferase